MHPIPSYLLLVAACAVSGGLHARVDVRLEDAADRLENAEARVAQLQADSSLLPGVSSGLQFTVPTCGNGTSLAVGNNGTVYCDCASLKGADCTSPPVNLTKRAAFEGNATSDTEIGLAVTLDSDGSVGVSSHSTTAPPSAFARSDETWSLDLPRPTEGYTEGVSRFPFDLSLSADGLTLVVCYGAFSSSIEEGAYVMRNTGSSWALVDGPLQPTPSTAGTRYGLGGCKLSADAGLVVASAQNESPNGTVYTFQLNAQGTYTEVTPKLQGPAASTDFAETLALSGDASTLAVGAKDASPDGAVHVYTRTSLRWTFLQTVEPLGAPIGQGGGSVQFGSSVALSTDGNTLAVIAFSYDAGILGTNEGALYVYKYSNVTSQFEWVSGPLTPVDVEAAFGLDRVAVSGDGGLVALGGGEHDSDVGAFWVYQQDGAAWTQVANRTNPDSGATEQTNIGLAFSADGAYLAVGQAPFSDGGHVTFYSTGI